MHMYTSRGAELEGLRKGLYSVRASLVVARLISLTIQMAQHSCEGVLMVSSC